MRPDLLDRVQLTCPDCTWRRESPAALRLERTDGGKEEVLDGSLRCVRCGDQYPIVHGVAILVADGHRRVAQEVAEVDDPVRLAGPHGLAQFGDLLPAADREGLSLGDFWPRLASLRAEGLAVDLSCSLGRAALGLSRTAAFTLALDASFIAARAARGGVSSGRVEVRVVEEGAFERRIPVDVGPLRGGPVEFVVADPERPPLPPGIAGFVLAANLLERQGDPEGFLRRAASLLAPRGVLAVASPFSWWDGAPGNWPSPGRGDGPGEGAERARDWLVRILESLGHRVEEEADLRLVLREHARLEQVVRPHLVLSRARGGPRELSDSLRESDPGEAPGSGESA